MENKKEYIDKKEDKIKNLKDKKLKDKIQKDIQQKKGKEILK